MQQLNLRFLSPFRSHKLRSGIHDDCVSQPACRTKVLLEIAAHYKIEERIRDTTPVERARVRDTESRGQLGKVFEAVESRSFSPGSAMGKAQHYFQLLAAEVGIHPLAEGGEGVLCTQRVDADGRLSHPGLVYTRKETRSIRPPPGIS